MRFWFGQRGWGWRLWGVSYGDKWFFGLSIKQGASHDRLLAQHTAEQHPDDAAVDRFAAAMKAKLEKKRQEGRGGWQSMTSEQLSALLHEHVRKGDPVDVANLAMMLHQNGQVIEPPATVVTDEMVEALRAEVEFGRKLNADLIHACALANIHSERLEEALWLIESAKDRGFGIDYARGVAQSALLRKQEESHEQ